MLNFIYLPDNSLFPAIIVYAENINAYTRSKINYHSAVGGRQRRIFAARQGYRKMTVSRH